MNVDRPDDEAIFEEVAQALDLDEAGIDALKLSVWETYEKADSLLAKVREIGHEFSIRDGDDVYVNVSWLATLLLMEGDQVMRGHGGCADHLRVVDWIETTVVAAQRNVEKLDSPTEPVVD